MIRHTKGEYVVGEVHTNTIEGYRSQLIRQIYGVHHWGPAKHLDRYVDESSRRYNLRSRKEADRVNDLLADSEGPLTYKMLIA
jgi:hypothetical protein